MGAIVRFLSVGALLLWVSIGVALAQVDYTLDNQPGASLRIELNQILAALVGNAGAPTEPTTTFPGQFWVDTSGANPVLKIRNASDAAWVTLGTVTPTDFEIGGSTAFSRGLIDDADAATARGTLGLGTLATQSGIAATGLTDYSSGTWTPSVGGTLGPLASTGGADGQFVRIGDLVFISGSVTVNTSTSGIQGPFVHLYGLPFAARGDNGVSYILNVLYGSGTLNGLTEDGHAAAFDRADIILQYYTSSNGFSNVTPAQMNSLSTQLRVDVSGFYITDDP